MVILQQNQNALSAVEYILDVLFLHMITRGLIIQRAWNPAVLNITN